MKTVKKVIAAILIAISAVAAVDAKGGCKSYKTRHSLEIRSQYYWMSNYDNLIFDYKQPGLRYRPIGKLPDSEGGMKVWEFRPYG